MAKVMVLVGTSKGGFIFTSDSARKDWQVSNILFKSWGVMHLQMDPRDQRIHAAVNHIIYGPTTHYSDDLGKTWVQAASVPAIGRASKSGRPIGTQEEAGLAAEGHDVQSQPEKLIKVWNITPGRADEPGVLYAGAEPASLFKSTDRGESWVLNDGFFDHPHRGTFFPGNGGLCLHTIIPDASNPARMWVGISTGGCYRTDDGGLSWAPYNKNVRADFSPEKFPEYGQCLHKMAQHPANPQVLYQQNHCGVYRSDNAGEDWIDIGEGRLPSRFGFPIAVDPNDPQTIFVALEESDEYRMSVDGRFSIWRSRDAGENWQRLTNGLPERAHLVVLREAMSTDTLKQTGLYVGTNTGQLFYSRNGGDAWELLADYLPPIFSVEAVVLPD